MEIVLTRILFLRDFDLRISFKLRICKSKNSVTMKNKTTCMHILSENFFWLKMF